MSLEALGARHSTMLILIALLAAGAIFFFYIRLTRVPRNIPVVGLKPDDWFPVLQARWRNTLDFKKAIDVAYSEHKDTACFLPVAGAPDHVLLPPAELKWLLEQPDSVFSISDYTADTLQTKHTMTDSGLMRWPVHMDLIPRNLAREAMNLIPDLVNETREAMSELWGGKAGETRQVCVHKSMQRAIGRATNRAFVGVPLCRNEALLENGIRYAMSLPMAAAALRFLWAPLRYIFAPVLNIPSFLFKLRFHNAMRGEIHRRLEEYDARKTGMTEKSTPAPANDFLQWSIEQAKSEHPNNQYLGEIGTLAGRILFLNLASIHTSSLVMTHALLDLAHAGERGPGFISELRTEIEGSLARHGGQWSRRALADMPKLDSFLRESQRVNTFVTVGVGRQVVAKGGVTTPSGVHLPEGIKVATHTLTVMKDPAIYDDPTVFHPFRFAQRRENSTDQTRLAFTMTSNEFFAFGAGRHACPGRVFASTELRLMLACIILDYDFEFTHCRPKNTWFGLYRVPSMNANIRVTRRDVWGPRRI